MSLLLALTAGGGAGSVSGTLEATLDGVTVASSGTVGHTGTLAATLDDVTVSSSGVVGHVGTSAITLDGIAFSASGTVPLHEPQKIGGDDVPRVEVWERRKKSKKQDEQLDKFIREQYEQITGKTKQEVQEIIGEYDDEDDVLLLLMIG